MVSEKEFNDLLVKYQPFIIAQVRRCGGGEDTEDYVQDVVLQVCRLRASFDPAKGSFVTWLRWQILSCVQQRRFYQNRRRPVSHSMEYRDDGTPVSEAVAVDNPLARLELNETVSEVFNLHPRQAHAVLQRAVGATYGEIADAYGATSQYGRELYATAIRNLRKRLSLKAAMAGAI